MIINNIQSIYHNGFEMNENKQNKINPEDNTKLMDEYNNENIFKFVDNYNIVDQKLAKNKEEILKNINIESKLIKNLSKSSHNNYKMINKKLNENKIESNHKSLVNMKDEKLNFENNEIYEKY
ncbi:hypothetical protein U3516DRAFT_773250 [Neocallimastix sp. 'constans']